MSALNHWKIHLVYFVAFYFVLSPAWISLAQSWDQPGYSHGYLVLGIFLFLILRSTRSIVEDEIKPNYWAAPFLVFASLLWTLSFHAHIQVIQWMLLPVMLVFFHILVFGLRAGWQLLFPILFLGLGIPVWDYLHVPLQGLTVFIITHLLQMVGIPIFIDAFFVTIPGGAFVIAGGCSGLRYLLVMLTLSSLYAYLNYSRWVTKAALVATAILFGLTMNWLRVFIIIVVGHMTDMQSGLVKDHEFFGWVLFAIIFIPFFFLAYKYADWFNDDPPQVKNRQHFSGNLKTTSWIVAFVCTFTLPLIIKPVVSSIDGTEVPVFTGKLAPDRGLFIKPGYHGADFTVDRISSFRDSQIQVSFRAYDIQQQGKELIGYGNKPYSSNWQLENGYVKNNFHYQEVRHRFTGQHLLVALQFSISGYKVADKTTAKLLEMFKPLMTKTRSGVLILAAQCEKTCDGAEVLTQQYIADNLEQIENL